MREHGLEQPDDAGGALQVADVGLDRADQQRRAAGRAAPSTAPSAAASTGSPTGVPVPCSSTYWTVGRVDPGALRTPRAAPRSCAAAAGRGQAVAGAVVVDRAAADHAVDPVAVGAAPRRAA